MEEYDRQVCLVLREGSKTVSKTTDANLDCAFDEMHFLHRYLILKSQQNRIELVTRPLLHQLFMSFLTLGKQDDRNLKAVADMLKVIL